MLSAEHRRPLAAFFMVLAVAVLIMVNSMRAEVVRVLISSGAPKSFIGALAPDMVLGQSLRHVVARPEPTPQAIETLVDQPVTGAGPAPVPAGRQAASLPSIATVVQSVSPQRRSGSAVPKPRRTPHVPATAPVRAAGGGTSTSPVTTPTTPTTPTTLWAPGTPTTPTSPSSGGPSSPITPPKVTDELGGAAKHQLTEVERLARQAANQAAEQARQETRRLREQERQARRDQERARKEAQKEGQQEAEEEAQRQAEQQARHQGQVEKTVQITIKGLEGGVTHRDGGRAQGSHSTPSFQQDKRHQQAPQVQVVQQASPSRHDQTKQPKQSKQSRQPTQATQPPQSAQSPQVGPVTPVELPVGQGKGGRQDAGAKHGNQQGGGRPDEGRDQHGSHGHRG